MSDNPHAAHKSHMPRQTDRQIRTRWRWCIAAVSLAGLALMCVNYQVARSINGYYFNNPRVPLGALDVIAASMAIYLLLVAISGRWRLFFRA